MISCCDQFKIERKVLPCGKLYKVLIIKHVITKKAGYFNLNDFDQSIKFC